MPTTRRHFLASAVGWPLLRRAPKRAASDTILAGFIGLGGRAQWLLKNEKFPNTRIVALADCFLPRCYEAAKLLPNGDECNKYGDYRRMLENEKLDAVFIETTTHARALVAIHAMQAGLDVYAEKPIALTVAEGRTLVRAARRYDRVFQAGTQQRSIPINAWASRWIRDGGMGHVASVIVCNFEGPRPYQWRPPQPVPDGLDWEQWLNQADARPYNSELQYGWSWYRDFDGGGQSWGVTGWGTHSLDQVQCALGADDTGPVELWPEDAGPQCRVTMRYASGTLLKLEGAPRRDSHADLGAIFVGEHGRLEIKRGVLEAAPPDLVKDAPEPTPEGPGENRWHIEDFLDCVRSRKQTNAHAEAAHRATTLCHLVNICRDLGRKLRWDPEREEFVGDAEATRLLSRPRRKGFELPKV